MVDRLRRDPFLFATLLVALWLASFMLAMTWYTFRDLYSGAGTVLSVLAAAWLFRARGRKT